MSNKLKQLEKHYTATPIPDALDFVVEYALQENKRLQRRKRVWRPVAWGIMLALLVIVVNNSSFFTQFLHKTSPVNEAEISMPKTVTTHHDQLLALEGKESAQQVYDNYKISEEAARITNNYVVALENNELLSLSKYSTAGYSLLGHLNYYTFNTAKMETLQLPDLFVNDRYIKVINDEIRQQIQTKSYDGEHAQLADHFTTITPYQSFYITSEHKLVIIIESTIGEQLAFKIPTAVLQPLLVSTQYIK